MRYCQIIDKNKNIKESGSQKDLRKKRNHLASTLILVSFLIGLVLVYYENQDDEIRQVRLKQFNDYVRSKAIIINASVPLKAESEYTPTEWCEFGRLDRVDMTAFFLTSGRVESLILTLESFFQFNTYPLKKVILTHDGPFHDGLAEVMKLFPNITLVVTTLRIGQLAAIDFGYQYIETEYYFHSEDDWKYYQAGFIQYCLQSVQFDPKLSQLQMYHGLNLEIPPFEVGPLKIITTAQSPYYSGFSFWSAVHTMSMYKQLKGGYNYVTFNSTFAKGVGMCESIISHYYAYKGYHGTLTRLQFAVPLPAPASPIKFWGEYQTRRTDINIEVHKYEIWLRNNRDAQKLRKQVQDELVPKFKKVMKQNPNCQNFKYLVSYQNILKENSP